MADQPNYVKEAFSRQENVIALAGFAVAGLLFNPGFLMLGGALEIVYLWLLSTNPRFHRVVLSEKNASLRRIDEDKKGRLLEALPRADRQRYDGLAAIRRGVFDSWQGRDPVTQSILQPSVEKLDYLLEAFLRTQATLNLITDHLLSSEKPKIQKQVKGLEGELAGELAPKLRQLKTQNLELLKQRLVRLDKLEEDTAAVRTQLDTIESAIKFIADQSVALTDPRQITDQIDRVVVEVGETEKSIQDVELFLGAADGESKREDAARQSAREAQ